MDFILITIGILSIVGMHFRDKDANEKHQYISRKQTLRINGIFVLLIFCSHFRQYATFSRFDFFSDKIIGWLFQLVVTTFLFYSGYGIVFSLLNKESYGKKLFFRSIKLWLHFVIAVLLFLVLNQLLGIRYETADVVLSFTGWTSIGNSNWYVFVIICLYFITWISNKICSVKDKSLYFFALGIVLTCALVIFMIIQGKPVWFYNTIFTFWAGALYSFFQKKIEKNLSKKNIYWISLAIVSIAFIVSFLGRWNWLLYEIHSIMFVSFILLITMKVSVGNPILDFIGKYTFEIYILQRLPMIALSTCIKNEYLLFLLSLIITIIISIGFHKLFSIIDKQIDKMIHI